MSLYKISSCFIILMASAISFAKAAQKEEVCVPRSPSAHTHFYTPHHPPLILSPMKSPRNYRTLEINTPLQSDELGQLMDRDCNEIYLLGVYVGQEKDGGFFKDSSLTISPSIINPDVEVLSLKCCDLTDDHITRLGEFKKLKKLNLASNHLTDGIVTSVISRLEKLESLSLALNQEISNVSVLTLLAMPSLTELDLSHNEKIDDGISEVLLRDTKLRKLNINGTGITKRVRWSIEDKYKAINK